MGMMLMEYFNRMDRESIALGEARMQLKLGMSRKRAAEVDDSPDLIERAERILTELIQTKDLFKAPRRS